MSFRRKITPNNVVICAMWITGILMPVTPFLGVFYLTGGAALLFISLIMVHLFAPFNSKWMVKIYGAITGLTPVKILSFDKKVYYSLVHKNDQDQSYKGFLLWPYCLGEIHLLPNGFVSDDCCTLYCYVWQPLDANLKLQLQLQYWDEWPDWTHWMSLSLATMELTRSVCCNQHKTRMT